MFDGALAIDRYHVNTPDKAFSNGHYFSDKPPGTVTLALPTFWAASKFLSWHGIKTESSKGWVYSSWIACSFSNGILAAGGGVFLFVWLSKWVPRYSALTATYGIFLGTISLPYCTVLLPHAGASGAICAALALVVDPTCRVAPPGKTVLAGLFSGVAIACEFTCGIFVYALFLHTLRNGPTHCVRFCQGALAPILIIPLYNWACFGDPMTLGYSLQVGFPEMSKGLYGISFPPSLSNCRYLLCSFRHGLLPWSPVLILILPGYISLYRSSKLLFWPTLLLPTIHLLVISGYNDMEAGMIYGPRYLSSMLPLLALPLAFGLAKYARIGVVLTVVSVILLSIVTLVDVRLPEDLSVSIVHYYCEKIIKGEFALNMGQIIGIPAHWSILPFFAFIIAGSMTSYRLLVTTGNQAHINRPRETITLPNKN